MPSDRVTAMLRASGDQAAPRAAVGVPSSRWSSSSASVVTSTMTIEPRGALPGTTRAMARVAGAAAGGVVFATV
jgi:hypothetical protein